MKKHRAVSLRQLSFLLPLPSTVWSSLPDKLRDPSLSIDSFRRQLKTFLFVDQEQCTQRIRDFVVDVLYKSTFTYLLTLGQARFLKKSPKEVHWELISETGIWVFIQDTCPCCPATISIKALKILYSKLLHEIPSCFTFQLQLEKT